MSKWWHILASAGMAAVAVVVPGAASVVAAHPTVASILAVAWAVLGNIVKSPVTQ